MFSENNYDIFKFLNKTDNDNLSKMSGLDLQEFLIYLNNYYLELRDNLGFLFKVTFGLEIEVEKVKEKRLRNKLSKTSFYNLWKLVDDFSLDRGIEINSSILRDIPSSWDDLSKICHIVSKFSKIDIHSGGHIHIGAHILNNNVNSWLNFIKLWSVYENIIFRFLYGSFLTERPTIESYARPMAENLYNEYIDFQISGDDDIRHLFKELYKYSNSAINFANVKPLDHIDYMNTIEFRAPNGSVDAVIWQNNVNFLVKLLLYSNSDKFNYDIVNRRAFINNNKYYDLDYYSEIFLDQVLEFCDMIFTNNLDKVYFLRQYLKSFNTCDKKLIKAKRFTK